jgi:hypothetical protein
VEIMEGWCLSGYDGRCQWSRSWLGSVVYCSWSGWNEIGNIWYFDEMVGNAVHHDEFG